MTQKSLQVIVEKQLKWHRAEITLSCMLIFLGIILIPLGLGIYFFVSQTTIVERVTSVPNPNIILSEIKMLYNFSRVLGLTFFLIGMAVLILGMDRLSLIRTSRRMASFIAKKNSERSI